MQWEGGAIVSFLDFKPYPDEAHFTELDDLPGSRCVDAIELIKSLKSAGGRVVVEHGELHITPALRDLFLINRVWIEGRLEGTVITLLEREVV
jgi:hypothetical protein